MSIIILNLKIVGRSTNAPPLPRKKTIKDDLLGFATPSQSFANIFCKAWTYSIAKTLPRSVPGNSLTNVMCLFQLDRVEWLHAYTIVTFGLRCIMGGSYSPSSTLAFPTDCFDDGENLTKATERR